MDFEAESPFVIKDLMLGEFLCQAGLLSDAVFLRIVQIAKKWKLTVGATLCQLELLNTCELFTARRLLNEYLRDTDNVEPILAELQMKLRLNDSAASKDRVVWHSAS